MDTKAQAIVNLLVEQRNQSLNAFAQAVGELAEMAETIKELESKLAAATVAPAVT